MLPNAHIFRAYDIRGVVGTDLSPELYYLLGQAYASFLLHRRIRLCPVGYDNRPDSQNYAAEFIKGLNDSGVDTIDLGPTLSQIVYFASYEFKTRAGAMITASHLPIQYNGLKVNRDYSEPLSAEEIQSLKEIIENKRFYSGHGHNQLIDLFPRYETEILKYFRLQKKWKVVVDGCNTYSGMFLPRILELAGCQVIEVNTKPDSTFPLGTPDPLEMAVIERLGAAVIEHQAEIGFAYDADGDRLAVVDSTGIPLWMDNIISLFAIDILDFLPGSYIIYNTLCSQQVKQTVKTHNGKPIICQTGRSFVKQAIDQLNAPFGGEFSGHLFFADNFFGHDDSAYASLRLLAFLERKKQTLAEAVQALPEFITSPEIKLGIGDDQKNAFVNTQIRSDLLALYPQAKLIDIDGLRLEMPDSTIIIRVSQNGPYIVIRFESTTETGYTNIRTNLSTMLKKYPQLDWTTGSNTASLQ